jgi:hypothetical protein
VPFIATAFAFTVLLALKWFSDRGHPQIIAAYYDGNVSKNLERWQTAADGVSGIIGYMCTTWRNHYDDMETFAKIVQEHSRRGAAY